MANQGQPQSNRARVLGIIVFALSFVAAFFLVRYLMSK